MKKIVMIMCLFQVVVAVAQNKQLAYGFREIPQSLMLNPSEKVTTKFHFGIPFLSQFHLNGGSTGVTVYDIFGNSSVEINTRIANKLSELKNTDFFTATQQLELIQFGWRSKQELYFSGGIYQEFDFIAYFPKDLAELAWYGNKDNINKIYDLGEVSTRADLLTVFHFGANKQLTKKLTVGARAKIYSSMASVNSTSNSGNFTTTLGDGANNIYEHRLTNVDMTVQTSGLASLYDLKNASDITKKMIGRAFLGGNLGVGMDLGFTYDITNKLTATGSILDLGVIFHLKDVETYKATGNYTLNGIELIFPPLDEAGIPYYDDLENEIEKEIIVDTITRSYSNWRPLKVNGAISYSFGKTVSGVDDCDCRSRGSKIDRNQSVGFQVFNIFRPKSPQLAGTVFYYRRFGKLLSAKATYTVDSYSFSNLGLAMVLDLGPINFYVAGDNILNYSNLAKTKSVSLQLGFNIKINQK